jgi:hypothetical protein
MAALGFVRSSSASSTGSTRITRHKRATATARATTSTSLSSRHARWRGPNGAPSAVPHHNEIAPGTLRAICRQLGIPEPNNPRQPTGPEVGQPAGRCAGAAYRVAPRRTGIGRPAARTQYRSTFSLSVGDGQRPIVPELRLSVDLERYRLKALQRSIRAALSIRSRSITTGRPVVRTSPPRSG